MEKGKLIFVSGGVRSGKSSFAEEMAIEWGEQHALKLNYIACGVPSDREMYDRISRHQQNRSSAPLPWKTWEYPYELYRISSQFSKQDILVLDCVTTLVNNYLFEKNMVDPNEVIKCILRDIFSLQEAAAGLIVVSNEVNQEIPSQTTLTGKYQSILGNVHQNIVSQAGGAYLVENGIPIQKKGAVG
ncbi:bifunctional adenosylcobinamide kinase/adenosylcobinamide-phosphate guanylyltransferase [Virgibacillus sp. L01]|uniref:bifunctional adenosylcobinamide kinase/adenosylcobinamide-phosphate guanylyltransferase n=1 Tax=Virgibacillus sp. L01 TaxID=3457429 RepID=UPI003FD040ED